MTSLSPPVMSESVSSPDQPDNEELPDETLDNSCLHIACEQMGEAMTAAPEGVAVGCIMTDYPCR